MLREWKEREYIPPKNMVKLFVKGSFELSKVMLKNFTKLKKVRQEKVIYRPPKRMYEIPEYKPGMKVVRSDEKYLRPTLFCNPYAKEIIALANHLGAFEKEPYEYANDVFEFVKRNVILQIVPIDGVVATLKRGYGSCIHKISLFIALCRAAGIKARYKLYALTVIDQWYDTFINVDPIMREWYDAMGYFMLHGEGEAYVDGKWVVADVGPTPERQVASGIPITKFGDDSIGIWADAIPGGIMRTESLPLGMGFLSKLMMNISPGSIARMNNNVINMYEKGKKMLEEMGGEEEYMKKMGGGMKMPTMKLEKKGIIFE
ncbi:MAG: transglutaminase family protein [Thermoplasmata archaeon]|nr:transglutaminase family protein [Thermoplasmata archaeon]